MIKSTLPDPDGAGSQTAPELEIVYNAASQITKRIDALDRETVYAYEEDLGWLESVTLPDPDGAGSLTSPVWSYEYDVLGNLLTETDPLGNDTDYAYDDLYRVTQITFPDPDGAGSLPSPTISYTYNDAGWVTAETDRPEPSDDVRL